MLISIVTVVRDRVDLVASCLDSVREQQGATCEHIVIDGGSSDGTAELLARRADGFAYWQSRPDGGIADAMNQGLARARGDWLLFLHADDHLDGAGALARVAPLLAASAADVVGFPIRFERGGRRELHRPRGPGVGLRFKSGFLHQATFFRRGVFERVGGFDTRYAIAMDYEWFLRAWLAGVPMATDERAVPTVMRDTGISSRRDWASVSKRLAEERAIHARHAGSGPLRALYALYWPAYLAYRRMRAR